jgi:hypothetical protein
MAPSTLLRACSICGVNLSMPGFVATRHVARIAAGWRRIVRTRDNGIDELLPEADALQLAPRMAGTGSCSELSESSPSISYWTTTTFRWFVLRWWPRHSLSWEREYGSCCFRESEENVPTGVCRTSNDHMCRMFVRPGRIQPHGAGDIGN